MVNGSCIPLRENSGLLTEADETVTLEPVAERVAVKVWLFPTITLPKLKLAGERLSCPTAVPDPAN